MVSSGVSSVTKEQMTHSVSKVGEKVVGESVPGVSVGDVVPPTSVGVGVAGVGVLMHTAGFAL